MQSSLVTYNIALILLQNKVFNTWNSLIQNLVFQKFAIMLGICKSGHISEISNISCVVWFHEGTGEILTQFQLAICIDKSGKFKQKFSSIFVNQWINHKLNCPLQHLSCTYIFTSLHPALSGFIMGEVSYPTIFAVH